MEVSYSFVIPVFNRPEEVRELLLSMQELKFEKPFEVVLVEDGSSLDSAQVVSEFSGRLDIKYYRKENTGPGDSRNFGMKKASGNYFLILDSDVILPPYYLSEVDKALSSNFVHCFGGPDAAHGSFSPIQKAINYSMTSFLTTGGIRGGKQQVGKFQPRSFNMGLSKEAFQASGGFGQIHPGEDPDLALRLRKKGFETALFPKAYVYHKRRIDWEKFFKQVYKFGQVRPILNRWHPDSAKLTFWFPALFSIGFLISLILLSAGIPVLFFIFCVYFLLVFSHSLMLNGDVKIAAYSVWAVLVQFIGYGLGFSQSTYYIRFLKENPENRFPKLFFQHATKISPQDSNQA